MKDDGSTIEERLEAALEEVAEYEQLAALMRRREEPWIKRWQQETGKAHTFPDYGEFLGWLVEKLESSRRLLAEILDIEQRTTYPSPGIAAKIKAILK